MINPLSLLQRLETTRAETLRRLEPLSQTQLDWRPPVTPENSAGWSVGEIFMHVAIDEHYLREQIARPLLESVQPPEAIRYVPPPPPHGLPKIVIQFWFERARVMTRRLLENWPADADLERRLDGGLATLFQTPPMNGAEWLAGFGGHEASHHRQLDAVLKLLEQHSIQ